MRAGASYAMPEPPRHAGGHKAKRRGTTVYIVHRPSMATQAPLTLPVIAPAQSARKALLLMRQYERSGVLAFKAGRWWLYEAARVVIALSDDPAVRLEDVRATRPPGLVTRKGSVASIETAPSARTPRTGVRRLGAALGLAPARGLTAARRRTLGAGPRDCYCRVDLKPVARGRTGGDCPYGHRGSVRCVE